MNICSYVAVVMSYLFLLWEIIIIDVIIMLLNMIQNQMGWSVANGGVGRMWRGCLCSPWSWFLCSKSRLIVLGSPYSFYLVALSFQKSISFLAFFLPSYIHFFIHFCHQSYYFLSYISPFLSFFSFNASFFFFFQFHYFISSFFLPSLLSSLKSFCSFFCFKSKNEKI